jgi:hypothetical protein
MSGIARERRPESHSPYFSCSYHGVNPRNRSCRDHAGERAFELKVCSKHWHALFHTCAKTRRMQGESRPGMRRSVGIHVARSFAIHHQLNELDIPLRVQFVVLKRRQGTSRFLHWIIVIGRKLMSELFSRLF